jgi:hypothetical protein
MEKMKKAKARMAEFFCGGGMNDCFLLFALSVFYTLSLSYLLPL